MECEIIMPPDCLKSMVRFISHSTFRFHPAQNQQLIFFADCFPQLIVLHSDCRRMVCAKGAAYPLTFLRGVSSRPMKIKVTGPVSCLTFSLFPEVLSMLTGMEISALNNRIFNMENYFSKDFIHEFMPLSLAARLEKIFVHLTSAASLQARKQQGLSAGDYQKLTSGNLSLEELRKHFAMADHQLLRCFKASTGLSPKRFLRGSRFSMALELIRNKKFTNLGDLAFSLNYYDHSHFIKDFRHLSGMRPSDFASLCELQHGKVSVVIRSL